VFFSEQNQLKTFAVPIISRGEWHTVDAAWIAARVRYGLTPWWYEMIALAASAIPCEPAELMRMALESEQS